MLSVPGEHGGVEQESWVESTLRTHVSMVLCLPLRETAVTPLTQDSEQGSPTVVRVPRVPAPVGSPPKKTNHGPGDKTEPVGKTSIQTDLLSRFRTEPCAA